VAATTHPLHELRHRGAGEETGEGGRDDPATHASSADPVSNQYTASATASDPSDDQAAAAGHKRAGASTGRARSISWRDV